MVLHDTEYQRRERTQRRNVHFDRQGLRESLTTVLRRCDAPNQSRPTDHYVFVKKHQRHTRWWWWWWWSVRTRASSIGVRCRTDSRRMVPSRRGVAHFFFSWAFLSRQIKSGKLRTINTWGTQHVGSHGGHCTSRTHGCSQYVQERARLAVPLPSVGKRSYTGRLESPHRTSPVL